MQNRKDFLREVESLVCGDRNIQYGDPSDDFTRTATMWNLYLESRKAAYEHVHPGGEFHLEHHDVAALQILLKLSRLSHDPSKKDTWLDIAGYATCGWGCLVPKDTVEAEAVSLHTVRRVVSLNYTDEKFTIVYEVGSPLDILRKSNIYYMLQNMTPIERRDWCDDVFLVSDQPFKLFSWLTRFDAPE